MAKTRYQIGAYELDWWATVEIDDELQFQYAGETTTTERVIKDMVEFWSGWQWRLKDMHNDYTLVFLKQLTAEIIGKIATNNYNLEGVIAHFKNAEGWVQMDGSAGIKILDVDEFSWSDNFDFDVNKLP